MATSVGPGVSYSHQGNFTYAHSLTQHIPYLFLQNNGCLSTNQSAIREAVMVLFRLLSRRLLQATPPLQTSIDQGVYLGLFWGSLTDGL